MKYEKIGIVKVNLERQASAPIPKDENYGLRTVYLLV